MTTPTEPGVEGLANCPFCGSIPAIKHWHSALVTVSCDAPEGNAPGYCPAVPCTEDKTEAEAIAAWNTRSPVPGEDFSSLRSSTCAPGSGLDGWVLVPKEPTPEMVAAFDANAYLAEGAIATSSREMRERVIQARTKMGYRAMLAAAPKHPDALGIGSVRNRAEGEREAYSDPLLLAKEALEGISDRALQAGGNVYGDWADAALLKINEARGA